jgi:hypothetical protein
MPTEEVFFQKAGPFRKEWFRVHRCKCGESYSKWFKQEESAVEMSADHQVLEL